MAAAEPRAVLDRESISQVGNSVTVIVVPLAAIDTLHWCAPVSLEAAMPANPTPP